MLQFERQKNLAQRSKLTPIRLSSPLVTARLLLLQGVQIGQQPRKRFGFVYRTSINNDVGKDRDESYKIHIIYNASASPAEKSYGTINDSPEAMTFSWEIEASAVSGMTGFKPTACVVIDSNKLAPGKLTLLRLSLVARLKLLVFQHPPHSKRYSHNFINKKEKLQC